MNKQKLTQNSVSQPEAEGPTLGWLLHREGGEGPHVASHPFAAASAQTSTHCAPCKREGQRRGVGERMGIGEGGRGGGSGTKTAVDGPPIVPAAHGWTGLGPGPPRRAWAIGGGDARTASVRLRERGAPVAATPSCCGTGSTAGDGTSTHMASSVSSCFSGRRVTGGWRRGWSTVRRDGRRSTVRRRVGRSRRRHSCQSSLMVGSSFILLDLPW